MCPYYYQIINFYLNAWQTRTFKTVMLLNPTIGHKIRFVRKVFKSTTHHQLPVLVVNISVLPAIVVLAVLRHGDFGSVKH